MVSKVLKQTERGQITLPKEWRDQFDCDYFNVEIRDDSLTIKPLNQKSFPELVEESWVEYKNGKVIIHEEMLNKYGL